MIKDPGKNNNAFDNAELIMNLLPGSRLIGGCVRDYLLKRKFTDIDIATTYIPDQVIKILTANHIKTIPTGIKFGTITALSKGEHIEITTLRQDVINNGRHPVVTYTDNFEVDAARRDFTINALSMDLNGVIYDYFDGLKDLDSQTVRFIGEASCRINEDYLRILRFFRFTASYAKKIDIEGLEASYKLQDKLNLLSSERIHDEFIKLLNVADPSYVLEILAKYQFLELLGLSNDLTKFNQLMNLDKIINPAPLLRLATLLNKTPPKWCLAKLERKYLQDLLLENKYDNISQLCYNEKNAKDIFIINNLNANSDKIKDGIVFIENYIKPNFPVKASDLYGVDGVEIGLMLKKIKHHWEINNYCLSKEELLKLVSL